MRRLREAGPFDCILVGEVPNPRLLRRLHVVAPWVKWVQGHGDNCPRGDRSPPAGGPCSRRPGAVCILSGCRSWYRPRHLWEVLRKVLLWRAVVGATSVVVSSLYMERLCAALGVEPSRLSRLAYETPACRPVAPLPASPRVLFVGRLVEGKGILPLARELASRGVSLDIAGTGPQAEELRNVCRTSGGRVRLLGWLSGSELDEVYERASVVVVPSLWPEPYGLVGPEALARGRAVVATDVGGIPEWGRGAGVSLVAPDPRAVAGEVERLLSNPGELERMGLAGRERMRRAGRDRDFGREVEELLLGAAAV